MIHHYTPIRMSPNEDKTETDNTNAGKDVEELEPSHVADGNARGYSLSGKQFASFLGS